MSAVQAFSWCQDIASFYGSTAQQQTRSGAIATYMESFLRDLREARDACNKLPFDDARACRCRRRRRRRRRVSPRPELA